MCDNGLLLSSTFKFAHPGTELYCLDSTRKHNSGGCSLLKRPCYKGLHLFLLSMQPVDAVYIALGKVLTISGRTIKEEAQVSPAIIQEAQDAIEGVLAKVRRNLTCVILHG